MDVLIYNMDTERTLVIALTWFFLHVLVFEDLCKLRLTLMERLVLWDSWKTSHRFDFPDK